MKERDKNGLKRQLLAQADVLTSLEEPQLLISAVNTGGALLKLASQEPMDGMAEQEFEELYAAWSAAAEYAWDFYRFAGRKLEKKSGAPAQAELFCRLQTEMDAQQKARERMEQLKQQMSEIQTEKEKLQADIRYREALLAKEKARTDFLKQQLMRCTPEMMQGKKKENEELLRHLSEAQEHMEQLIKKQRQMQEKKHEIEEKIRSLETSIKECPVENQNLMAQYNEKKEMLEQLLQAKVQCSEERQEEVKVQIEMLIPEVEQLQTAKDVLDHRLEELSAQKLQYDREKQELSTNLFTLLEGAFEALERILPEHEERLAGIRETADTLAERTESCRKLRAQYGGWFDSNVTPLEAMIEVLGRQEAEGLRAALDPGKTQRVRTLMEQTRKNLEELDAILEQCAGAVWQDQKMLERRARL